VGINFASLITCSAIFFPVAAFISTKNRFTLCHSFNLKKFEREMLYDIWPYRGTFIICLVAYNPIYSWSNSSGVKLHLCTGVRWYGPFGLQFLSIKSISSSQYLISVYEAWSYMLDVWSLVPFGTQQITTMKVVFGNSETLPLPFFPGCSPKSVASRLLPRLPFFLTSRISLAHFDNTIATHCSRIHLASSKLSKGSQVLKVSKKSITAVAQCSGPSRSCFKQFCPGRMDRCFILRNPATHTSSPCWRH